MDEEGAIAARTRGQSIEKIAKARRVSVAEVYAVFDRFCDRTLNPDARRHGLAFELARLDRLLEACWPKAVGGDLAAIALAEKLSARRCVMLGLHAPTAAILKIIDESAPRVTSTQQLEATLDALTEDAPVDGQAPNQEWQVCVRHCVVRTGDTGMNGSIGSESELIRPFASASLPSM